MDYNANPLVYHTVKDPQWLADGRFWYRDHGPDGDTYMLVDPARHSKAPAFDHAKVAAALNAAIRSGRLSISANQSLEASHLPVDDLTLEDNDRTVMLTFGPRRVRCDLRGAGDCRTAGNVLSNLYDVSPNGRKAAFLRDNNLWVRDVSSGRETQLTADGAPDFGYATDNSGWIHSNRPILEWSPDSKKIATYQQDQRKVGRMFLVNTTGGHPALESWPYPLAGDENILTIQRVIIDVDARRVVRLKMAPDLHRSSLCDDLSCVGVG